MIRYLDDILLLAGCGCVLYGLSLWSLPAAWITGGIMLIALAVIIGKAKAKNAT